MISAAVDSQICEHLAQDGRELEAMARQSGCEIHMIGPRVTIDHKVPIFTHRVHARGVVVQLMSGAWQVVAQKERRGLEFVGVDVAV